MNNFYGYLPKNTDNADGNFYDYIPKEKDYKNWNDTKKSIKNKLSKWHKLVINKKKAKVLKLDDNKITVRFDISWEKSEIGYYKIISWNIKILNKINSTLQDIVDIQSERNKSSISSIMIHTKNSVHEILEF